MPAGFSANSFYAARGDSLAPVYSFVSETSLGFYRSASSTMVLSYGTLIAPVSASSAFVMGTAARLDQGAIYTQIVDLNGNGRLLLASTAGDGGNSYYDAGGAAASSHIFRSDTDAVRFRVYSRGTVDLQQSRLISTRTAASLDSTTLMTDEMAFSLNASGASLAIRSGGTIWYFTSSASTKG